jgi:hypothetical protein
MKTANTSWYNNTSEEIGTILIGTTTQAAEGTDQLLAQGLHCHNKERGYRKLRRHQE